MEASAAPCRLALGRRGYGASVPHAPVSFCDCSQLVLQEGGTILQRSQEIRWRKVNCCSSSGRPSLETKWFPRSSLTSCQALRHDSSLPRCLFPSAVSFTSRHSCSQTDQRRFAVATLPPGCPEETQHFSLTAFRSRVALRGRGIRETDVFLSPRFSSSTLPRQRTSSSLAPFSSSACSSSSSPHCFSASASLPLSAASASSPSSALSASLSASLSSSRASPPSSPSSRPPSSSSSLSFSTSSSWYGSSSVLRRSGFLPFSPWSDLPLRPPQLSVSSCGLSRVSGVSFFRAFATGRRRRRAKRREERPRESRPSKRKQVEIERKVKNPFEFEKKRDGVELVKKGEIYFPENADAHKLTVLICALNKFGYATDRELLARYAERALALTPSLYPKHASLILNVLARHRFSDAALLEALGDTLSTRLRNANAQDLALIASAYGNLGFFHRRLLKRLSEEIPHKLPHFEPQHVVAVAHAFAKLEVQDELFFDDVAEQTLRFLEDFPPRPTALMANILGARVRYRNLGFWQELLQHAWHIREKLTAPEVIMVVHGASAVDAEVDEALLRLMTRSACEAFGSLSLAEKAQAINACSRLRFYDPRLFDCLANWIWVSSEALESLEIPFITQVLHACGRLRHNDRKLVQPLCRRLHHLALTANSDSHREAERGNAHRETQKQSLSPQVIAVLLRALSRLGAGCTVLAEGGGSETAKVLRLSPFSPIRTCTVSPANVVSAVDPSSMFGGQKSTAEVEPMSHEDARLRNELVAFLTHEVSRQLPAFTPQGLCESLDALSALGVDNAVLFYRISQELGGKRLWPLLSAPSWLSILRAFYRRGPKGEVPLVRRCLTRLRESIATMSADECRATRQVLEKMCLDLAASETLLPTATPGASAGGSREVRPAERVPVSPHHMQTAVGDEPGKEVEDSSASTSASEGRAEGDDASRSNANGVGGAREPSQDTSGSRGGTRGGTEASTQHVQRLLLEGRRDHRLRQLRSLAAAVDSRLQVVNPFSSSPEGKRSSANSLSPLSPRRDAELRGRGHPSKRMHAAAHADRSWGSAGPAMATAKAVEAEEAAAMSLFSRPSGEVFLRDSGDEGYNAVERGAGNKCVVDSRGQDEAQESKRERGRLAIGRRRRPAKTEQSLSDFDDDSREQGWPSVMGDQHTCTQQSPQTLQELHPREMFRFTGRSGPLDGGDARADSGERSSTRITARSRPGDSLDDIVSRLQENERVCAGIEASPFARQSERTPLMECREDGLRARPSRGSEGEKAGKKEPARLTLKELLRGAHCEAGDLKADWNALNDVDGFVELQKREKENQVGEGAWGGRTARREDASGCAGPAAAMVEADCVPRTNGRRKRRRGATSSEPKREALGALRPGQAQNVAELQEQWEKLYLKPERRLGPLAATDRVPILPFSLSNEHRRVNDRDDVWADGSAETPEAFCSSGSSPDRRGPDAPRLGNTGCATFLEDAASSKNLEKRGQWNVDGTGLIIRNNQIQGKAAREGGFEVGYEDLSDLLEGGVSATVGTHDGRQWRIKTAEKCGVRGGNESAPMGGEELFPRESGGRKSRKRNAG
uniref:RNA-editing substrate-binding complex 6 protein domain-containing protein n=1 Tax=Toxoplasma gondii COUG TaxID=1074873 RepID=A0A2G8XSS3_TOXGO|nr:hypothetical protein TGCOUG_254810 [Toxoplasma gondii COUG]